ncbi:unnamed protein product [Moneuplotes crassus]|uniref:Uncharacterized protein n=1 Tax=Euplotes crassus TaxID=5936 RepID=A0AAD1UHZ3_EUPCR|nr:unnamed protein product [Moneuplotes crassus]
MIESSSSEGSKDEGPIWEIEKLRDVRAVLKTARSTLLKGDRQMQKCHQLMSKISASGLLSNEYSGTVQKKNKSQTKTRQKIKMSDFGKIQRSQYISKLLKKPKDKVIRYPPRSFNIAMYNLPSAAKDMKRIRRAKQKHKKVNKEISDTGRKSKAKNINNGRNTDRNSRPFEKRRHSMPVRESKRTSHSKKRREETLNIINNKIIRIHFNPKPKKPHPSKTPRLLSSRLPKRPLPLQDQNLIIISRLLTTKKAP